MRSEKRRKLHRLLDLVIDLLTDDDRETKHEPPRLVFRDAMGRETDLLKTRKLPPLD